MTASRLTRLRLRLSERFSLSEVHTMLVWAALVGFVGALATIAFREAIRLLEWLVTRHTGGLVEIAEILPRYLRILFPAVGGGGAGFLPQAGRLALYREPAGPGVRVDSGVTEGSDVTVHYDPLLAKLVVHAASRPAAPPPARPSPPKPTGSVCPARRTPRSAPACRESRPPQR